MHEEWHWYLLCHPLEGKQVPMAGLLTFFFPEQWQVGEISVTGETCSLSGSSRPVGGQPICLNDDD